MNRVTLIGNVGSGGVELRDTQGGQRVGRFSLATNFRYRNKDGKKITLTEWHSIVVWGEKALHASQLLPEGRLVCVEGRLQTRSFDQDGVKHYRTNVICSNFELLGPNPKGQSTAAGEACAETQVADDEGMPPEEDDIPF